MFIFGEFNVFSTADAKNILFKANRALTRQGKLLLEPHTFAALQKIGKKPPTWYTSEEGLFSDKPHLSLSEHFIVPPRRSSGMPKASRRTMKRNTRPFWRKADSEG
jgi:hypothetical protein